MIIRVCLDEGSEEQSGFRVVMASGEQTADAGPGHLSVVVLPRDARTFVSWPLVCTLLYPVQAEGKGASNDLIQGNCGCRRCSQQVSTGARPFSWGHLLEFSREGSCHESWEELPEATE